MKDILREIAEYTASRVEKRKKEVPLPELLKNIAPLKSEERFKFEKAIAGSGISIICECKKASPSAGIISEDFPYLEIADKYEKGGAAAISVLTEPKWFLGSDSYLKEIASRASIPCLRKDFIVDEYMLHEARALGAGAVLLITSLLDKDTLERYIDICDGYNMSALVEVRDESEIKTALQAGARVIGINNRNLRDFNVDIRTAINLSKKIPKDIKVVAESGIKDPGDVKMLHEAGISAFLIGESIMRAEDISAAIKGFKGDI